MKRLVALLCSFCIIFSSAISAEAKPVDAFSHTYIEYITDDLYAEVTLSFIPEGNSTDFSTDKYANFSLFSRRTSNRRTSSKTYTLKNSSGKVLATYTLTGTFTYNGSSSTCTRATCSTSISDSTYSFTHKTARPSGNTAIGSFTLASSGQTISKTLTLTCNANGTIQ